MTAAFLIILYFYGAAGTPFLKSVFTAALFHSIINYKEVLLSEDTICLGVGVVPNKGRMGTCGT